MKRPIMLFTLLAALAVPALAAAQDAGRWAVHVRGGAFLPQEASALQPGAVLGLEAMHRLTPRLAVGPAFDFAAGSTDGRYFIAVMQLGPDSTRLYEVGQDVMTVHVGANALVDLFNGGRLSGYAAGGVGAYALYLDVQSNDGPTRVTGPLAQVGGGVRYAVRGTSGIHLDVRNLVYLNYDRDDVNPVRPEQRNLRPDGSYRFPAAEHDLPGARSTVHNLRLTLGFTYIPGPGAR
jgi:hypothetical protein